MSVSITFTIPGPQAPDFKAKIKEASAGQGMSMSEYIVEAVAEYMRSHHEQPTV